MIEPRWSCQEETCVGRFPSPFRFFWLVMAITIAYGLMLSLVSRFCLVAMIKTYNEAVRGQEPDPQWEEHLQTVSGKFRELRDKARAAAAGGLRPAPGPGSAA